MALLEIKTVKITEKGQIALPREMRELEGFEEGTKIVILAFPDHIELRPLEQLDEKIFPALASEKTLAKDWLSLEDEQAWKHL